ncbi:hypothetical protein KVT40_007259 [Elsinoe batatas]|uniref:Uncharacterized protein n=1 Tax=Elsinoe batatas TaxID=2601811 RepID=A0A8K0L498_9PEZI|nr:hypothetical protein KVT40_007259 [Elsinoe batatas]
MWFLSHRCPAAAHVQLHYDPQQYPIQLDRQPIEIDGHGFTSTGELFFVIIYQFPTFEWTKKYPSEQTRSEQACRPSDTIWHQAKKAHIAISDPQIQQMDLSIILDYAYHVCAIAEDHFYVIHMLTDGVTRGKLLQFLSAGLSMPMCVEPLSLEHNTCTRRITRWTGATGMEDGLHEQQGYRNEADLATLS